jgi:hypothetical protein
MARAPSGDTAMSDLRMPIIFALTILFTSLLVTMARAAEMPKELGGSWCFTGTESNGTYIQCKKADANLIIERNSSDSEDESCEPVNVVEHGKLSWTIQERCSGDHLREPKIVTLRYSRKGKYLAVE